MDTTKRPKVNSAGLLGLADRQINHLKKTLLPSIPHRLTVDVKHPYGGSFAYESESTPFEPWEYEGFQYLTMISDGDRGIADVKGDLEDFNSRSPSLQNPLSQNQTPNAARESKALKKMSYADYKNKKAGVKTVPQPGATNDSKPTDARNPSAQSEPGAISRLPSFEGISEPKQNGTTANATGKVAEKETQKLDQPLKTSDDKNKSAIITNGHSEQVPRVSLQDKDTNKDKIARSSKSQQPTQQVKHGLPPRPGAPVRGADDRKSDISESRPPKRPLDSSSALPAEKRARIEPVRTPPASQKDVVRRQEERKPQSSPLKNSSQPSKAIPTAKATDTSEVSKTEKPLKMPRLLSPLPADLEPPQATIPKVRISEPTPNDSPKTKSVPVTNAAKSKLGAPSTQTNTPRRSPSPSNVRLRMPRLLSPTLPDVVEDALLRMQRNKSNTVEARHENARRPDAPGVARKTPKVGRKTNAEASKSLPVADKPTLIVKLKYKNNRRNDIARILKLRSGPTKEFLRLEKERLAGLKGKVETEDEKPLASIPKPIVAAPVSKKRPSDVDESRLEPPAKRAKPSEKTQEVKPRLANVPSSQPKSPLPSAPPPKTLLATPKKGDALKSVAMRKIDSSDGHARTPQAANPSTSAPASAEKPLRLLNGHPDTRSSQEVEAAKTKAANLDAQALKLKRKMDELLGTKTRITVSESQKILGICVGLECVVKYMQSFDAHSRSRSVGPGWESGVGLWEYIEREARPFPILSALAMHIGAIFKEEVVRSAAAQLRTDAASLVEKAKDPKYAVFLQRLGDSELGRDKLWREVRRVSRVLEEKLGSGEGGKGWNAGINLGPWTTVEECRDFTLAALERYAKVEKTGWRVMI